MKGAPSEVRQFLQVRSRSPSVVYPHLSDQAVIDGTGRIKLVWEEWGNRIVPASHRASQIQIKQSKDLPDVLLRAARITGKDVLASCHPREEAAAGWHPGLPAVRLGGSGRSQAAVKRYDRPPISASCQRAKA